jgi:homogentisate 1,2-dioxygenase
MSGQRIRPPHVEGRASRQAHVDLPEGTYERELGRDGFFGPASHMYHTHPPTSWSHFEGPLRPRAFDTRKLQAGNACPWDAPALLGNAHVEVRAWTCPESMDHLVRNADGDDLLFLQRGSAEWYCDYGHLSLRDGDFVVVPRGTLWRLECAEAVEFLIVEAKNDRYRLPDRGSLGQHAVFDPGVLDIPALDESFIRQRDEAGAWRVAVRGRGEISTLEFPHNPLDCVGWKGDLSPLRLNWRDIRPVTSARYHLPPSAHTTWLAERFVVCTFCPRPLETDPGALKLPFFHSNEDYDELIFYHRGEFTSRDKIEPGMLTLHPSGFTHGPHPAALRASQSQPREHTDEVAVMIDTRDPLVVGPAAERIEWPGYVDSWRDPE